MSVVVVFRTTRRVTIAEPCWLWLEEEHSKRKHVDRATLKLTSQPGRIVVSWFSLPVD